MATVRERIQAAWDTGDPLALHRQIEQLAAEGHPQQALEDGLEALLLAVRAPGADDDAQEIIHGVWDRLTGWCHKSGHIEAQSRKERESSPASPSNGSFATPAEKGMFLKPSE
jgi:hypothetical protein